MRKRSRIEPIPDLVDLPKLDYRQIGREVLHLLRLPVEYCQSMVDEISSGLGYSQHKSPPTPEITNIPDHE